MLIPLGEEIVSVDLDTNLNRNFSKKCQHCRIQPMLGFEHRVVSVNNITLAANWFETSRDREE